MLLCPKCDCPMRPMLTSVYCPKCEGREEAPAATAEKYAVGVRLVAKPGGSWWADGEEFTITSRSESSNGEATWEIRDASGSTFVVQNWAMPKFFKVKGS